MAERSQIVLTAKDAFFGGFDTVEERDEFYALASRLLNIYMTRRLRRQAKRLMRALESYKGDNRDKAIRMGLSLGLPDRLRLAAATADANGYPTVAKDLREIQKAIFAGRPRHGETVVPIQDYPFIALNPNRMGGNYACP